jgi:hypothetical protein
MSGRYATLYRQSREALEKEAETRLGRALTPRERNLFRNCGTLTMLESLGMKIFYADSAEELDAQLAGISMDARFNLAVEELIARLELALGRKLTTVEQQQLYALGNIEELWALEQQLHDAPPDVHEVTLKMLLANRQ